MKHFITKGVNDNKLRCIIDNEVIDACDYVARQSVDIATDVTRLNVECKGEQDCGENKAKTGSCKQLAVSWGVVIISLPSEHKKIHQILSSNYLAKLTSKN